MPEHYKRLIEAILSSFEKFADEDPNLMLFERAVVREVVGAMRDAFMKEAADHA